MSPIRAAALCLALLAPAAAAAQSMLVFGSGTQRELTCNGQNIDIAGEGHRVTLRGNCGTVMVAGSGHVVTLDQAARLEVMGEESVVTASGTLGAISMFGRGHRVKGATPAAPATAEIHGDNSLLELTLNGPSRVLITGEDNRLLWTAAAGVPDPVGDIGGQGNRLERAR